MYDETYLDPVLPEALPQIRDKVYEKLRRAILEGRLKPGTRLVERRLAEQLKVSRTPVREVIRMLELEGLISYLPRAGAVVAIVDKEEVLEIYRIRAVLEGLAARLAAEKIGYDQIKRLENLLGTMEIHTGPGELDQIEQTHQEFNDLIYKAAGSPRLYSMIASLVDHINRYVRMGYGLPGRIAEANREHRRLVEALALHDGDLAEAVARKHIENSRQAFFSELVQKQHNDTDSSRGV
ncbi:MAG: GntR family transcriptional regulator [Bacillota bacterium]